MLNQYQTPLLDTLQACTERPHAPFYTPGHKRGAGISPKLAHAFGKQVFRTDLPELTELDNLFAPNGVIQQAQQLAAEAFGASNTWFLVNGSTCGIEAAILATCNTGDKIILPRNVHSSAISGLILSGAIPIFIHPEYDPILDIAYSITPQAVATTLQQHPDAKAVIMVYPTYNGICGDVNAIAQITHKYHIPLLVDEAHGAHFAFHPQLPISALAAGADLTVQSIHKTLGAMTQASMLHLQGNRIDINRVNKALQLVQSTSPSYLLLASLDAARQQMAINGQELMSHTLQLADEARKGISEITGLSVLNLSPISENIERGFVALDKTRLTVTLSGLGFTGFSAEEILDEQLGVTAEFSSLHTLTFIISLGNTQADIAKLIQGFTTLAKMNPLLPGGEVAKTPLLWNDCVIVGNPLHISPREAFFANTQTLPIQETMGYICAENICPYPPGIPLLMPGEVITQAAIDYLQQVIAMGGFISGCEDASLGTLKVVKI
ncbi:MAG: aminotransferase class I/II-fold pyridoxal phosphate-dependent enzyme [Nostocaceae cyanobacterium]|nr:aminotransferase class I/II-fold pyridoxal phosphate-dependent enzyme [Nostocaceae cyanobacterium]